MDGVMALEEGYPSFVSPFKVAFGLFFVLNTEYPHGLAVTLELLQRYIFKIHPDAGSKSKKVPASKRKVITLLNKISKFNNQN